MTFALGRRFIIVDGAERWKDKDLDAARGRAGRDPAGHHGRVLRPRGRPRSKAPARLHEAVQKAGGDISAEQSVKPWELPKWVLARAQELGLRARAGGRPRLLVRHVGERQQRLLRELEKLALAVEPGARVDPAQIEELTAPSAERKAWSLADALVAGTPGWRSACT